VIFKKSLNPYPDSSKQERVAALLCYVLARNDDLGEPKCSYWGCRNFSCDVPELQSLIVEMAATATAITRSPDPIRHYELSWRKGSAVPTGEQVEEAVEIFRETMGIRDLQLVYALHTNTECPHLHIVTNRVHPVTNKMVVINGNYDIKAGHLAAARIVERLGLEPLENAIYVPDGKGGFKEREGDRAAPLIRPASVRDMEVRTGMKSATAKAVERAAPAIAAAATWEELHRDLEALGMTYALKGGGAVVVVDGVEVKASSVAREASLLRLEKRLGVFRRPDDDDALPPSMTPAPEAGSRPPAAAPPARPPGLKGGTKPRDLAKAIAAAVRAAPDWPSAHRAAAELGGAYLRKGGGAAIYAMGEVFKASNLHCSLFSVERKLGPYRNPPWDADGTSAPPAGSGTPPPPEKDGDPSPPAGSGTSSPPADAAKPSAPEEGGGPSPPAGSGTSPPPEEDGEPSPPEGDGMASPLAGVKDPASPAEAEEDRAEAWDGMDEDAAFRKVQGLVAEAVEGSSDWEGFFRRLEDGGIAWFPAGGGAIIRFGKRERKSSDVCRKATAALLARRFKSPPPDWPPSPPPASVSDASGSGTASAPGSSQPDPSSEADGEEEFRKAREVVVGAIEECSDWECFLGRLRDRGLEWEKKGGGAVIRIGGKEHKASNVCRAATHLSLVRKFRKAAPEQGVRTVPAAFPVPAPAPGGAGARTGGLRLKEDGPDPVPEAIDPADQEELEGYLAAKKTFKGEKEKERRAGEKRLEAEWGGLVRRQREEKEKYFSMSWRGLGLHLTALRETINEMHAKARNLLRQARKDFRRSLFEKYGSFISWLEYRRSGGAAFGILRNHAGESIEVQERDFGREGEAAGIREKAPGREGEAAGVREQAPGQVGEAAGIREEAPGREGEAAGIREEAPGREGEAAGVREEAPGREGEAAGAGEEDPDEDWEGFAILEEGAAEGEGLAARAKGRSRQVPPRPAGKDEEEVEEEEETGSRQRRARELRYHIWTARGETYYMPLDDDDDGFWFTASNRHVRAWNWKDGGYRAVVAGLILAERLSPTGAIVVRGDREFKTLCVRAAAEFGFNVSNFWLRKDIRKRKAELELERQDGVSAMFHSANPSPPRPAGAERRSEEPAPDGGGSEGREESAAPDKGPGSGAEGGPEGGARGRRAGRVWEDALRMLREEEDKEDNGGDDDSHGDRLDADTMDDEGEGQRPGTYELIVTFMMLAESQSPDGTVEAPPFLEEGEYRSCFVRAVAEFGFRVVNPGMQDDIRKARAGGKWTEGPVSGGGAGQGRFERLRRSVLRMLQEDGSDFTLREEEHYLFSVIFLMLAESLSQDGTIELPSLFEEGWLRADFIRAAAEFGFQVVNPGMRDEIRKAEEEAERRAKADRKKDGSSWGSRARTEGPAQDARGSRARAGGPVQEASEARDGAGAAFADAAVFKTGKRGRDARPDLGTSAGPAPDFPVPSLPEHPDIGAGDLRRYFSRREGKKTYYLRGGWKKGDTWIEDDGDALWLRGWKDGDYDTAAAFLRLAEHANEGKGMAVSGRAAFMGQCARASAEFGFEIANPEMREAVAEARDRLWRKGAGPVPDAAIYTAGLEGLAGRGSPGSVAMGPVPSFRMPPLPVPLDPVPGDLRRYFARRAGKVTYYIREDRGSAWLEDRGNIVWLRNWQDDDYDSAVAYLRLSERLSPDGTVEVHGRSAFRDACVRAAAEFGFRLANRDLRERAEERKAELERQAEERRMAGERDAGKRTDRGKGARRDEKERLAARDRETAPARPVAGKGPAGSGGGGRFAGTRKAKRGGAAPARGKRPVEPGMADAAERSRQAEREASAETRGEDPGKPDVKTPEPGEGGSHGPAPKA
jgi:hypothetical protein